MKSEKWKFFWSRLPELNRRPSNYETETACFPRSSQILVISHLRGRVDDVPLVELASLPLMRAIGTLMRLGDSVIAKAFPDWRTIKASRHTKDLAYEIELWSLRWNLNADWRCDHALRLLRHWLLDDPLRWTFLDTLAPTRNPRLAELWHFVTKDKEFDVKFDLVQTFHFTITYCF